MYHLASPCYTLHNILNVNCRFRLSPLTKRCMLYTSTCFVCLYPSKRIKSRTSGATVIYKMKNRASSELNIHFKQINQLDAAVSQVYYLTFMYSSIYFGSPYTHHQELNNCSSSLWFYRWSVVVAVLLVVVGPARQINGER